MVHVDEDGLRGEIGPLLAVVVPDTVRTDMQLIGELDMATDSVLGTLIEQQIATGHLNVRIDVSELSFCDVRGLRALLQASRRLAEADGQLTLTRPRPLLSRIATLCGIAAELRLPISSPTGVAANRGQPA